MTDNTSVEIINFQESDEQKSLVISSDVPDGMHYRKYKQFLRKDFFASCAYCTMSEAEATAIRMTIDHYEPRSKRPDLENSYNNLMYSCDPCNVRKGTRCPTEEARKDGYRFFRPDADLRQDHFVKTGVRLQGTTNTGNYSVEALDLNRLELRRLRQLREKISNYTRFVAEGIMALRNVPIDRLPPEMRSKFLKARKEVEQMNGDFNKKFDEILLIHAVSPLSPEIDGI